VKKAIPILLIAIILIVSFIGNVKDKSKVDDYTIDLEEELRYNKLLDMDDEDNTCEGNTEISGGISLVYVEGLELFLEYLSPKETLQYSHFMNVYADGVMSLLSNDENFYMANKTKIGDVFGIYDYEKYVGFVDRFSSIDVGDEVKSIKVNEVLENSGLLEVDIEINFNSGTVRIEQLLSYVYVENEPKLFLYTKI